MSSTARLQNKNWNWQTKRTIEKHMAKEEKKRQIFRFLFLKGGEKLVYRCVSVKRKNQDE